MSVDLTAGEAARLLRVSPNALRSWERHGLPVDRTEGFHRRYDRRVILGLKDALDEGLRGQSAVDRGIELCASGKYREPGGLRERMERLEQRFSELIAAVDRLACIVDDRG